jgi:hypothetical protein
MGVSTVKPEALILRCYAEHDGDLWVAVCVDLSLAAQGDTPEEARHKLVEQMREYLLDALAGEDQAFGDILLTRKAPWQQVLKYHYIKACYHLHLLKHNTYNLFSEIVPVAPKFG